MIKQRRSMKPPYSMSIAELRAVLYGGDAKDQPPREGHEPDLPFMDPDDRPQDTYLDGRDMRFVGYKVITLEQGGAYADTMPQVIEVTDADGRKAVYVPLSRDGKAVQSAPVVEALKRCGGVEEVRRRGNRC